MSRLACSLAGRTEVVRLVPDTLARRAYGAAETTEPFRCGYGLNPAWRRRFSDAPLAVSGVSAAGDVRIVELPDHPFFLAALFVPQLASRPEAPHPLVLALLRAALAARGRREAEG